MLFYRVLVLICHLASGFVLEDEYPDVRKAIAVDVEVRNADER